MPDRAELFSPITSSPILGSWPTDRLECSELTAIGQCKGATPWKCGMTCNAAIPWAKHLPGMALPGALALVMVASFSETQQKTADIQKCVNRCFSTLDELRVEV